MSSGGPGHGPELRGRHSECEAIGQLLDSVRAGQSRVLVMRGEAGVGKTALLDFLLERAPECRVARAAGVESEMELAFATLHQLCAPFLDRLDRLPGPQRDALATAFGLSASGPPDRFMVGLAVLTLLAGVADDQPLVCLVDDAQWLDRISAQVLAFVARRLLADRVALVFAIREPSDDRELAGLEELRVTGLRDVDARALLDSVITGPVEESVRDRLVAESGGNPLALLELSRGLTPADVTFGFGLPEAMPLASRIEEGFARRLDPLPPHTRRLLLTAAAEPVGDVTLLWRAAGRLGIRTDAAGPAEAAGLIELGAHVRFRHPLVRSAAYRSADPDELLRVHRALAEATDPGLDPDRRAWHHAQAATGPDDAVAAELERSAGRAQARGGIAAAAAFLQRAAELTLDPFLQARRTLAAAQARHQAGAPGPALALLAIAQAGPLDELQRARADLLIAQITYASRRGNDGPALLLAAARKLQHLDSALARDTYLEAFSAAMLAGRLAGDVGGPEVAKAARRAPRPSHRQLNGDLLLNGRALLFTDGYKAALPVSQQALRAFRGADTPPGEGLRWLFLASVTAADLWDDESWCVLSARHARIARSAGALNELPLALNSRIFVDLFAGDLAAAASLVEEVRSVRAATGSEFAPYGALALAAWRGQGPEAARLTAAILGEVTPRGEGMGVTVTEWASAVLFNGLGRHADAMLAAQRACEQQQEFGFSSWSLAELIEAAARTSVAGLAAGALERLSEIAAATGTDWALGVEARSRGLLSDGREAERYYLEAIERLGRTTVRMELARAHLLYGEWLRHEPRQDDARQQLRTAHTMFSEAGAGGFADRARRELAAAGEAVRRRPAEASEEFSAQEAQIARLACDGRTNPEIGAELFISPRTVEWHLRKVYVKLGVSSRRELRTALASN
ncbi:MAG TPA: AAA family ATPase [Streptosporangiaceae bacterium]